MACSGQDSVGCILGLALSGSVRGPILTGCILSDIPLVLPNFSRPLTTFIFTAVLKEVRTYEKNWCLFVKKKLDPIYGASSAQCLCTSMYVLLIPPCQECVLTSKQI